MTVVAITAPRRTDERHDQLRLNTHYLEALERVGLVPVVLPTSVQPATAVAALNAAQGLVLSGGEDVDPARYGAGRHQRLGPVDPHRDEVEAALAHAALAARLPVFAICRGMQILNVALGGSLYQDLPSECPGPIAHGAAEHDVAVDSGSLLSRAVNGPSLRTNSRHHQALKDIAPALAVVARASDGVVEAVELREPEGRWLVGVQWHPEDLPDAGLFQGFAEAVLSVGAVG